MNSPAPSPRESRDDTSARSPDRPSPDPDPPSSAFGQLAAHLLPRRLRQALWFRELIAGTCLALARFFLLAGVLFLLGWSYSVWGSPASPLRHLLIPGLTCLLLGFLTRFLANRLLRWVHRAGRIKRRYSKLRQSMSQEVQKLGPEDLAESDDENS